MNKYSNIHSNILKIASMMIGLLMMGILQVEAQTSTSKIYYATVEAKASDNHDGSSWDNAMPLKQALEAAKAGDEVRVKGYTSLKDKLYIAPSQDGFQLKSGVKLRGGYTGEKDAEGNDIRSTKSKARYNYTYQSALVGDIEYNDEVPTDILIFPENSTRYDNASHVLKVDIGVDETYTNDNKEETVVEGFTIAAGHASGRQDGEEGQGGGIFITNSTDNDAANRKYVINECFFVNNYASLGGAIYVDANVTNDQSTIGYCGFYNNVSGTRSAIANTGGAVYMAGAGILHNSAILNNVNGGAVISAKAKIVNSTIIHNTVAGVDLVQGMGNAGSKTDNGGGTLYNTLIWGNSTLSKATERPVFKNCAYPEVDASKYGETDENGNLKISTNNYSTDASAWLETPSSLVGYDRSFNSMASIIPTYSLALEDQSALLGAGSKDDYDNIMGKLDASRDLAGNVRTHTTTDGTSIIDIIDIGAFERERLATGRRRYVKQGGNGDGTEWGKAMGDIQAAINDLANNGTGKGEVWIAKGTYSPSRRIGGVDDSNVPKSFQMKDGISLYGGFAGDEKSIAERERTSDGNYWAYKNETILQGETTNGNLSPTWNSNEESWRVSSNSSHVVWFAPEPGSQTDFQYTTVLDGCTIQGGTSEGNSDADQYETDRGAGVYMTSANAILRGCIVRYNYAGMSKKSDNSKTLPRGGGVYCKNGQVRYCLVYNNSAAEGGGIYLEDMGFINSSMIANNSGVNGGGVYLSKNNTYMPDNYLFLTTSIVANNTSTRNGGVYVASPAVVEQNTIVNNYTSNVTSSTATETSYTGGLYITQSCIAVNNILLNNALGDKNDKTQQSSSSSLAQIYNANGDKEHVVFYNNAISDVNSITWNQIYQTGTYELSSSNLIQIFTMGSTDTSLNPFQQYTTTESFLTTRGVQSHWSSIDYLWSLCQGSALRTKGLLYSQLPIDILFKPSTDFLERNFESRPPIGAYIADEPTITFDASNYSASKQCLRLYYNSSNANPDGNGSSWSKEYASLNELLTYLGELSIGKEITTTNGTATLAAGDYVEILCREGEYEATAPYTFQESEANAKTFNVKPTAFPLYILGGYPAKETLANPTDSDRNPAKYRTEFTGNQDGDNLSDGLFHVFRVEAGANVTFDGIAITKGYASGKAYITRGGAMLIGSVATTEDKTNVTLKNSIIENNCGEAGAAIAATTDGANISLTLVNCVINNNTCQEGSGSTQIARDIIDLGIASRNNTLALNHVSFINNIGLPPSDMGSTSFAAGNQVYSSQALTTEGANNTQTMETTNAAGAANFANPTNAVGAYINGNVYLGGYAEFRPLTSSNANNAIINQGVDDSLTEGKDINGNDRTLGGASDLGAYEAILPKAGKVIYVRSYNTTWDKTDETEGRPDFNLLVDNAGKVYDGSTWDNAIMGNAVCYVKSDRTKNDFYVHEEGSLVLQSASVNNTNYSGDYPTAKWGQQSNAYADFFMKGVNGNTEGVNDSDGSKYNLITNNRDEDYVSGLQYAIEKAAEANKNLQEGEEPVQVWVGAGVYTDFKGFVIRNGVKVYGGFPKDGNPGEEDRLPLLSQYFPARKQYQSLNSSDYETILQVRSESPVYMTDDTSEIWNSEGTTNGSTNKVAQDAINDKKTQRHYVLYQPDVCIPTWGVGHSSGSLDMRENGRTSANVNRYPGNILKDPTDANYQEYKNVEWDGFSIRHGYIVNYPVCRDGGAGVRVFRGVQLKNLVIVNNFTHGSRTRGGGLYMDGDSTTISNSFILKNFLLGGGDTKGGGAYMINGIGYNMVVANNRVYAGTGGGIFIESAKFYNNTVCYNQSASGAAGIYHWQDATTKIVSSLTLYNCIVFENFGDKGGNATQVESGNVENFTAKNCYIGGNLPSNLTDKFSTDNDNIVYPSNNLVNPFTASIKATNNADRKWSEARLTNDYRLNENEDNKCLNNGTEDIPNVPSTDMDYTNRIKDCAIDIGAYEADNTANIKYQSKVNLEETTAHEGVEDYVYYVTQNGFGTRSGNSPENAACADKLSSILKTAGDLAITSNANIADNDKKHKVYVKVAGYEPDENGERFVYHANTLADPSDPRSYTFVIPDGVWLMGGYYEGDIDENGILTGYNWDENQRNVTQYQTILSAKTQPKLGSAVEQEVNGYHAVTFGEWPTSANISDYNSVIQYRAVVDGCYLIDGQATDNAGFKSMGGAAIVPKKAHMRNCIIEGNEALKGGALCLLPGSMVTGSLIINNKAKQGGAIYAVSYNSTLGTALNFHAYAVSCTIAENTATEGGGIYQELGALMGGNLVVWGNTATTDKNISGVVDQQFYDIAIDPDLGTTYYPYNDCFVERYKLPANTQNTEMSSNLEEFFSDNGTFKPRAYSSLIDNGVETSYNNQWIKVAGVLTYDILGNERKTAEKGRLTAGAYGMATLTRDPKILITRLFVSDKGGADVSDAVRSRYLGRSFKTPFNSLDAALDYIRQVRITPKDGATEDENGKIETVATDKTKFEILMTGGTYRPSSMREGDNVSAADPTDRRLNSFVIPPSVSIYGGFHDDDPFSSNLKNTEDADDLTTIMDGDTEIISGLYTDDDATMGSIAEVIHWRNTQESHMSDLNKNGLIEPWEFSDQTVLSGDIKASAKEKNVYHVVFSKIPDSTESSLVRNNDVLLDGIVIMNGETKDDIAYLKDEKGEETNEEDLTSDIGHGGGIYSYNVSYTLNRCCIINNIAVHGGGIYVKDGSVDIINSMIGGNWAGSESHSPGVGSGHGGGVCVYLTESSMGNLHAVNSLFVNNEAIQAGRNSKAMGGAIYMRRAENLLTYQETKPSYRDVSIMNCIIAKNASEEDAAIRLVRTDADAKTKAAPTAIYNTVLWNNEDNYNELSGEDMEYCASDKLTANPRDTRNNVLLDTLNMTANGPRFKDPVTQAGKDGFDFYAKWNPAAISVLTDAGNGVLKANVTDQRSAEGYYVNWWQMHDPRLYNVNYDNDQYNYIDKATDAQEKAANSYSRYMGPLDEDGNQSDKTIDIGMYEFQYNFSFSDNQAVYIATEGQGREDGSDWLNCSTDLRGAIIAMAHATGNTNDGSTKDWTHRKIYVKKGEYFSPSLTNDGTAFTLTVNNDEGKDLVSSLEIVGSCTGIGLGEEAERNFAEPTVIVPNRELETTDKFTNILLNVTTNGKPVTISGVTFKNSPASSNSSPESSDTNRKGMYALINDTQADDKGKLTLQNCGFRNNGSYGLEVKGNNGTDKQSELLVYNTLFADGASDGIHVTDDADKSSANLKATIVNTTFAQNTGADMVANDASMNVYNTVSWENGSSILGTEKVPAATDKDAEATDAQKHNKKFVAGQENEDVLYGPNFTDPANGDYSIRPSRMLLNKGNNQYYKDYVLEDGNLTSEQLVGIKDFYNHERFTGTSVDIGASECNSVLQPIIYVNSLANDGTGASWDSPVNNLKNAISLAGVYANTNQTSPYGYVFVHRDIKQKDVHVDLPGIKVFGSMDGTEMSTTPLTDNADRATIEKVVKEVLGSRKGVIEQTSMSTIEGLTMNFNTATRTEGNETENISSVVDGFMVDGAVSMNNGYLSTSVIAPTATVTASSPKAALANNATLYNSLALGQIGEGIRAVNVTATTTLPDVAGNSHNRSGVTKKNSYVKDIDYWCYQLDETSEDINPSGDFTSTVACANAVGHNFDLAGNTRIHYKDFTNTSNGVRDNVDNGCFETWKLLQSYLVTAQDYPHGKSVIYVTAEKEGETDPITKAAFHELRLDANLYTENSPFSPGFLLLQQHAGLRGGGSYISLTNFAVERNLQEGKKDLCVMPFSVTKRELYQNGELIYPNGNSGITSQGYTMKTYNADKRATYDYQYSDSEDKAAWNDAAETAQKENVTEGVMLTSERTQTLRAYGGSYTENPNGKTITLVQHNNQESWLTSPSSSQKFTHKENMGWNLFGSPYLCAMNYQDMEYGRVIYPYKRAVAIDEDEDDGFITINTDSEDGSIEGYIPAFDAVFTQTATLSNTEQIKVSYDKDLKGTAYQTPPSNLAVQLNSDRIIFNAVPSQDAKVDYDLGTDGVKWMTAGKPNIYIERNGGRYSLLSAVNIEGSLCIGVSVPQAGEYSLSIPEDCETSKYETVWLKDLETGKAVDLLEGNYNFTTNEAGEMNSRFTISFNRMAEEMKDNIGISTNGNGIVKVEGTQANDQIRIYMASGLLATQKVAKGSSESIRTTANGTVIVEVTRSGKQVAVRKIAIK